MPGPRPDQFLGVTTGGVVVIVDAATGTQLRELTRASDPTVPQALESAAYTYVRSVALSFDRRTAYRTLNPEPACGDVSEIPATGGEAKSVGYGVHVTPGPPGHFAATGCGLRIQKGIVVLASVEEPPDGTVFRNVAWSADGRHLAVERSKESEPSVVLVFDLLEGDTASSAIELRDPEGVGYGLPAFRNDGRLVVAQPPRGDLPAAAKVLDPVDGAVVGSFSYGGPVVGQAYDATHTWLLVTIADGRLRWFGGGDQGDLGSGYIAADW